MRVLTRKVEVGQEIWLYAKGDRKDKQKITHIMVLTPSGCRQLTKLEAGQTAFIKTTKNISLPGSYMLS